MDCNVRAKSLPLPTPTAQSLLPQMMYTFFSLPLKSQISRYSVFSKIDRQVLATLVVRWWLKSIYMYYSISAVELSVRIFISV